MILYVVPSPRPDTTRGAHMYIPKESPPNTFQEDELDRGIEEVIVGPIFDVHARGRPQVELLESLRESALPREQLQKALATSGPPQ
eukprot:4529609-Pyramimonas_sp.AAC.1